MHSVALDHVASHIGKAVGIAAILRGMPLLAFPAGASAGAVVFPLDVCAQHGLRQEQVLRKGGGAEGLRDAVFAVATRANDHLITARKMLGDAGDEGRGAPFGAFLSAVSVFFLGDGGRGRLTRLCAVGPDGAVSGAAGEGGL